MKGTVVAEAHCNDQHQYWH